MRVLLITAKYPPTPCGVGDHTCGLAQRLGRYGHEVVVYTSSAGKPVDTEVPANARIIREISVWNLSANPRILEFVQGHRIGLVHIQYTASWHNHPVFALFPWTIKCRARAPVPKVVVTLHELAAPMTKILPGPTRRLWLIPLLLFSDAIIVTSQRDASYLRWVPWVARKLRYIPLASHLHLGAIPQVDRQQIRSRLGIREDEVLLARFGFVENIQVTLIPMILRSTRQLLDRGYRIRLLFVGGGNEAGRTEVLAFAKKFDIERHLLFTGYCAPDEASRYLSSADIAVQPYPEGVCERRSTLQVAMALGLPIVSTQRGIPPSMFRSRDNVMLAPVGDSLQMANAIAELIDDALLRQRLRKNVLELASRFSWESLAAKTHELYQALGTTP